MKFENVTRDNIAYSSLIVQTRCTKILSTVQRNNFNGIHSCSKLFCFRVYEYDRRNVKVRSLFKKTRAQLLKGERERANSG